MELQKVNTILLGLITLFVMMCSFFMYDEYSDRQKIKSVFSKGIDHEANNRLQEILKKSNTFSNQ